ncbi:TOBE domain-containing protein [Halomonas halodenitrificans]|uniref:TOBE domain-containing protein n=1 Tax=Halomonas halodenitrificans TaxID=28252 RepID=UPI000489E9D0|nr:TOBE domain-containing protein [Halomonas halodenitrificans]
MPSPPPPISVEGQIWFNTDERRFGGHGRISLLSHIAERGSISQAAKAMKMSYKAAWDAVDQMNNLAGEPLVERSVGGKGGGATRLTARGHQLVANFHRLEALHKHFVNELNRQAGSLTDDVAMIRRLSMKSSARNHFSGRITALTPGAVNDEVEIEIFPGQRLVAVITRESSQTLGLEVGSEAFALIKASSVIVVTEAEGARFSARNRLAGRVERLQPGAVNSEVVLALEGGGHLAAIITHASAEGLGLAEGQPASAIFKASSVIVGAYD